jgi:AcrR family transcriptional regulator
VTLRERRAARTRTALIDAAVELCLREGYEHATIERIAEAADISPRTFARYFAGKEAVFMAVLEAVDADIVAELRRQPDHLGPLEALRVAHEVVLTRIADHPRGRPSADQVTLMLRVVNSSDALRQKAMSYRNAGAMKVLAERMGVSPDDRGLDLAVTLFTVTLVAGLKGVVGDTAPDRLGPRVMVARMQEAFGQVAGFAAELNTATAHTPAN